MVALSYDALVVRLNSVQHLLDSLGGLERMVVERWDDGRPRSAKAREGAHAYDWVAGMFDGARRAAGRTRDHLARFIGVKVGWGLGGVAGRQACRHATLVTVSWGQLHASCSRMSGRPMSTPPPLLLPHLTRLPAVRLPVLPPCCTAAGVL